MRTKQHPLNKTILSLEEIESYSEGWLLDCDVRDLSSRTLEARRSVLEKFLWYAKKENWTEIGSNEIRRFLKYVSEPHDTEKGRWENNIPNQRHIQAIKPSTVQTYHRILRTFFYWTMEEGSLPE